MKPLIPIQEFNQQDTFSSTTMSHELITAIQGSCVLKNVLGYLQAKAKHFQLGEMICSANLGHG